MRDERDKIREYKNRRDARLAKRGFSERKTREDSVESFYERRNGRRSEKQLPDIDYKKSPYSIDKRNGKWYNIDGEGEREDGNQRIAFGLCEKYGIDLPKDAGPKEAWAALAGKGITPKSAYQSMKAQSKIKKGSGTNGIRVPKDVTKWASTHVTKSGVSMPKIKEGAKWNQSTLNRLEKEAEEAGFAKEFTDTIKNLTEDDVVYQTEANGDVTACVPGLATRFDKTVVGRSPEIQALYDSRRKDGEKITNDMISLARELNSSLDSLENNFKGGKSASRKIDTLKEKGATKVPPVTKSDYDWVKGMDDITRFTMVSGYDEMVDNTNRLVDALQKKGYQIAELDNKWTDPGCKTYKGIHVKAISESGQKFEVQIHSREDLAVKEVNHFDYNIERDTKRPQKERDIATQKMIKRYSKLPMPKGIETLKSFVR